MPTFTDAEGYLAAGLCSLGFTVVFDDASEDWLRLSDNHDPQLIVLSQPDRKIDGEDLKGQLRVYPSGFEGSPNHLLRELDIPIILNEPDCSKI